MAQYHFLQWKLFHQATGYTMVQKPFLYKVMSLQFLLRLLHLAYPHQIKFLPLSYEDDYFFCTYVSQYIVSLVLRRTFQIHDPKEIDKLFHFLLLHDIKQGFQIALFFRYHVINMRQSKHHNSHPVLLLQFLMHYTARDIYALCHELHLSYKKA